MFHGERSVGFLQVGQSEKHVFRSGHRHCDAAGTAFLCNFCDIPATHHVPVVGCKSQRRLEEMAPRASKYRNGEGGGDEKGRRRGDEERGPFLADQRISTQK